MISGTKRKAIIGQDVAKIASWWGEQSGRRLFPGRKKKTKAGTTVGAEGEEDEEEEEYKVVEVVACGCVGPSCRTKVETKVRESERSERANEWVCARRESETRIGRTRERTAGELGEERRRAPPGSNKPAEVEVTLKLLHGYRPLFPYCSQPQKEEHGCFIPTLCLPSVPSLPPPFSHSRARSCLPLASLTGAESRSDAVMSPVFGNSRRCSFAHRPL